MISRENSLFTRSFKQKLCLAAVSSEIKTVLVLQFFNIRMQFPEFLSLVISSLPSLTSKASLTIPRLLHLFTMMGGRWFLVQDSQA
jgi:hypothetical protein